MESTHVTLESPRARMVAGITGAPGAKTLGNCSPNILILLSLQSYPLPKRSQVLTTQLSNICHTKSLHTLCFCTLGLITAASDPETMEYLILVFMLRGCFKLELQVV